MDPRSELAARSRELREHLEEAERKGVKHLDSARLREWVVTQARAPVTPAATPAENSAPAAAPNATPTPKPAATSAPPASTRGKKLDIIPIEPETPDRADRMRALETLDAKASTCQLCGLCQTRKQVVFSRGAARNRVMFIGEAPGADEDRLGEPFVGRAGKLLDQILDAAGFQRDEVYVANILKCRPPNNRDPKPEEIEACTPYLEEQIDLVAPRIICALGKFAAQFLTDNPNVPVGKLRGRVLQYKKRIKVVPTYHPAALLRNPNFKRTVWEDVQLLRAEYLRELQS